MKSTSILTAGICLAALASCKKKGDDTPATANVNYQITTTNRSSGLINWTAASGTGKQVSFKGTSSGGARVEEYKLVFNQIDLFTNAAITSLPVPPGNYQNAEFNDQMIPSRDPGLRLQGSFTSNGTTVPVRVNIDQFVEIATRMPSINLEAGRNYTANLTLDLSKVTEGITATQLNNAQRTNGEIVIAFYSNSNLLLTIINNINNVMRHEVTVN